jgi:hypothetical protein
MNALSGSNYNVVSNEKNETKRIPTTYKRTVDSKKTFSKESNS